MSIFDKKATDFLEELLITPSPTGFEADGQKKWASYTGSFADDIEADTYGSAFAKLSISGAQKTIMLEAHCDEIGMIIQHIDDSGFISVNRLGGSDPAIARARKVHIHSRKGIVAGIIGNTAVHLQDKENQKQPGWKDIFIDIGVENREEALSIVQIGDPITYADDFEFLSDNLLSGRALDNRIGGFIIAEAFRRLSSRRKDLKVNVIALNAVQEEIGGFGARMMSYRLMPDVALVTDVTHATDTPGINQKEHGQVKLGQGPSITHGAASHPTVVKRIEEVADHHKIPIQHEAAGIRTGTDTDSIYYQRTGIPSALISLPLRYMHSPVEMASMEDVGNLVNLMEEIIISMNQDESFRVLDL
ncbi:MAG: M42 family metallopeptidase [Balneolales bacterium]